MLGPDDDPRAGVMSHSSSSSSSPSISTPVPESVGDRDQEIIVGETKKEKGVKRTLEDEVETKEARRKHKRLKKERKAARATKRAEKALAGEKAKEKKDRRDRKAQKHRDEETRSEENAISPFPKEVCKHARTSVARSGGDGLGPEGCVLKRLEKEPPSTNNGQLQDTSSHRLPRSVAATGAPADVVLTTKKKKKRKDTP